MSSPQFVSSSHSPASLGCMRDYGGSSGSTVRYMILYAIAISPGAAQRRVDMTKRSSAALPLPVISPSCSHLDPLGE